MRVESPQANPDRLSHLQKCKAMYCLVQFRMLIFILTYVWYIVNVSCNNDTLKAEINNPSAGKLSTNLNTSNISVASGEVNANINKNKHVFWEGGSMTSVNTEKNYNASTSKTSIQNQTLNEKILQYDIQFGLNDSNLATDRKPHTRRKGIVLKETSSEDPVEHSGDGIAKTAESGDIFSAATNVASLTPSAISPTNTTNSTIANGTTGSSTSSQDNLSQGTSSTTISSNSTAPGSSRNGIQNGTSENKLNVTESQPLKPKPEFTRDDSDVDDNSSYSLTNSESDYIIPVVATIFAAPLLIVLGMFLYKRSKEFWERRHYRRMDFLIDGMYND